MVFPSCDITTVFGLLRDTDCPKCQLTKNHIAFGQTEAWSRSRYSHGYPCVFPWIFYGTDHLFTMVLILHEVPGELDHGYSR